MSALALARGIALLAAAWLSGTAALACASNSCEPTLGDVALRGAPIPGHTVTDGRYVMGTVLEIELPTDAQHHADAQRAVEDAFARARALDVLFSRFLAESDVSRLNASAGHAPIEVDPEMREILAAARRGSAATDGAFDITVGPVIEAWMRAAERDRPLTAAERAQATALVGVERIDVGADGRVGLAAGSSIDLGGIAKGYALDQIAHDLRNAGIERALLSFGQSSVHALGAPRDAPAWRLLLRAPEGGFAGTLALRDQALSVSSSVGQASEIGGVRYGHVVDPRTGMALVLARQAAVVSASGTEAEILSKALLVLDESRGRAVAAALDAEALVIDGEGNGWQSPGWVRVTSFAPLPVHRQAPASQ